MRKVAKAYRRPFEDRLQLLTIILHNILLVKARGSPSKLDRRIAGSSNLVVLGLHTTIDYGNFFPNTLDKREKSDKTSTTDKRQEDRHFSVRLFFYGSK